MMSKLLIGGAMLIHIVKGGFPIKSHEQTLNSHMNWSSTDLDSKEETKKLFRERRQFAKTVLEIRQLPRLKITTEKKDEYRDCATIWELLDVEKNLIDKKHKLQKDKANQKEVDTICKDLADLQKPKSLLEKMKDIQNSKGNDVHAKRKELNQTKITLNSVMRDLRRK
jgi:hypothetical protein